MRKVFIAFIIYLLPQYYASAQHVEHYSNRLLHGISDTYIHGIYPADFISIGRDTSLLKNWWLRKLFYEDFVVIKKEKLALELNPVLYVDMKQMGSTRYLLNGRAIRIRGTFGEKVKFYSAFFENQATFPDYLNDYVKQTLVVPGQGASKIFESNGHDFSRVESSFDYSAVKWLNISVGQGKHFIGYGYRSLLWSDYSNTYPYLSLRLSHNGWKYFWMLSEQNFFKYKYYAYHTRRPASVMHLSWEYDNKFAISFTEITIWNPRLEGENNYYWLKLLPIPIMNTISSETGIHRTNNILGLNMMYKPMENIKLYSQLVADFISLADVGFSSTLQVGFSVAQPQWLTNMNHHVLIHAELNMVGKSMYTSPDAYMAHMHYNQPMSHPLGNDFSEFCMIADYRYKRIGVHLKMNAVYRDSAVSTDSWIPNAEVNNYGELLKYDRKMSYTDVKLYLVINPRTNLQLHIGYMQRNFVLNQKFYYITLSSQLYSYYTDI